ncbi:hypothetical protein OH76DRAFT_1490795 [Lentinus brumalis]|uniref:Uncharacterized protein n=1 Tax=Lentinus brumalis TaxID=2498619 RepID=A0A371CHS8_9APHY|nr:hypothetical protein OH76DRAFT_1490798 [Polyporus brumalis]RDX39851.1 hypothetical protein OH76DRAFT_1490795 [Polyporus brumalis]
MHAQNHGRPRVSNTQNGPRPHYRAPHQNPKTFRHEGTPEHRPDASGTREHRESRGRSPNRPHAAKGWGKPHHYGAKRKQVSPASYRYSTSSGGSEPVSELENAYAEGYRDGEEAREQKLAPALAQSVEMHAEIKELRTRLDLALADARGAAAEAEFQKALKEKSEAELRALRGIDDTEQLRTAALASRAAAQLIEEDIEMHDRDAPPVVNIPRSPRNNGEHAGPRNGPSPPVHSAGGGRDAGTPPVRKTFEQYREERYAEYADTFPPIPTKVEDLRMVMRMAESEGGAAAAWRMKQWRRAALKARDAGVALTQCESMAIEWSTPPWYKAEQDAIRSYHTYTLMTPPTAEHPFEHWQKHFQKNRETIRKGLRREADGSPNLATLEGLYLANLMFHETDKTRAVYRAATIARLAGLFVDPLAYQSSLERLDLEPAERLDFQPYTGPYPITLDLLCQHAAVCGITPWDVTNSFLVWAREHVGTTYAPPVETGDATVAQPTFNSTSASRTEVEVEAPGSSITGSATSVAESGITTKQTVDPVNVPLPPDADDVDMTEGPSDDLQSVASA